MGDFVITFSTKVYFKLMFFGLNIYNSQKVCKTNIQNSIYFHQNTQDV